MEQMLGRPSPEGGQGAEEHARPRPPGRGGPRCWGARETAPPGARGAKVLGSTRDRAPRGEGGQGAGEHARPRPPGRGGQGAKHTRPRPSGRGGPRCCEAREAAPPGSGCWGARKTWGQGAEEHSRPGGPGGPDPGGKAEDPGKGQHGPERLPRGNNKNIGYMCQARYLPCYRRGESTVLSSTRDSPRPWGPRCRSTRGLPMWRGPRCSEHSRPPRREPPGEGQGAKEHRAFPRP